MRCCSAAGSPGGGRGKRAPATTLGIRDGLAPPIRPPPPRGARTHSKRRHGVHALHACCLAALALGHQPQPLGGWRLRRRRRRLGSGGKLGRGPGAIRVRLPTLAESHSHDPDHRAAQQQGAGLWWALVSGARWLSRGLPDAAGEYQGARNEAKTAILVPSCIFLSNRGHGVSSCHRHLRAACIAASNSPASRSHDRSSCTPASAAASPLARCVGRQRSLCGRRARRSLIYCTTPGMW